jgi:hypothetical protein
MITVEGDLLPPKLFISVLLLRGVGQVEGIVRGAAVEAKAGACVETKVGASEGKVEAGVSIKGEALVGSAVVGTDEAGLLVVG